MRKWLYRQYELLFKRPKGISLWFAYSLERSLRKNAAVWQQLAEEDEDNHND